MEQYLLPDVLQPDLDVVFCGTAAGKASAELEAYYAHSNNKFWSVLFETKLTPRKLRPHEFMQVTNLGLGLTDLCKDRAGNDNQIPKVTSLQRSALRDKILLYRPVFLAFTSLEAGKRYCGYKSTLGRQTETIGKTSLHILPSTSPMAAWNWESTKCHWQDLADLVQERHSNG
jgi:double-stranded uracil-DNA glycosylase